MDITGNGAPPLNEVIATMLGHLEDRLPDPLDPGLPTRSRLLSVRERPVGLSNGRGVEVFGSLVPVTLKGGRVDVSVAFEVWASQQGDADSAALSLHSALSAAKNDLRIEGFLRIDGADFSTAEKDEDLNAWRKTASYQVLYEYHYQDVDDALSFITRIPVSSDPEEAESPDREIEVVTGRMVRWQQREEAQGVPPPPTLVVQGRTTIQGLTVAALLPDTPGAGVELLRTFEGAAGAPAVAATLQDFAAAPHIHKTYASLALFLADLTASGNTVALGDLAGNPGSYEIRTFTFGPALVLPRPVDRLEISTSADAWVGSHAVLYLRADGA